MSLEKQIFVQWINGKINQTNGQRINDKLKQLGDQPINSEKTQLLDQPKNILMVLINGSTLKKNNRVITAQR